MTEIRKVAVIGAGTVGIRVDASGTGEGNAWFTPYIGGAGGFFEGASGWGC